MQIIVIGTPRSGSSIVTRLINLMGAVFNVNSPSVGFKDESAKGFWERSDVNDCNEEILRYHGCEWNQLANWKIQSSTPKKVLNDLEKALQRIERTITELDKEKPWVIKDPRLCLTFTCWRPLLPQAIPVIVWRHPLETAMSLKTVHQMPLMHGLALWEYYYAAALSAMKGIEPLFVSHHELMEKPDAVIKSLLENLQKRGAESLKMPDKAEWEFFFRPELQVHKLADFESPEALVTPHEQKLMDILSGKEPIPGKLLQPSEVAVDSMHAVARMKVRQSGAEDSNRKFAAIEQQCRQLSYQLEDAEQKVALLHEAQERLAEAEAELEYHRARRRGLFSRLFNAA